jgi:hypothetical protein
LGLSSSITGTPVELGSGGGGGTPNITSSSYLANAGGDSAGRGGYETSGGTAIVGESGKPNRGGGGGGGSDKGGLGGSGGSGVVILSWGPVLEVARTPVTARVGSAFTQPIQIDLRDPTGVNKLSTSGAVITVSAPSGVLRKFNSDNTSQSVTSATATTDATGLATFEGLGFEKIGRASCRERV